MSRPGFDDAVYHISEKGLYAYIDRLGKWMHAGANLESLLLGKFEYEKVR